MNRTVVLATVAALVAGVLIGYALFAPKQIAMGPGGGVVGKPTGGTGTITPGVGTIAPK